MVRKPASLKRMPTLYKAFSGLENGYNNNKPQSTTDGIKSQHIIESSVHKNSCESYEHIFLKSA